MERNLKILENWFMLFKNYRRLSLCEAKNLYNEMLVCESQKKKQKWNTLVMGTMYVLYNNLKSSFLLYLPPNKYSVEDIIHSGIQVWMEFLDAGKIFDLSSFSDFFLNDFFYEVSESLLNSVQKGQHLSSILSTYLNKEEFYAILIQYLSERKNGEISYTQFIELFKNYSMVFHFYSLFEDVYTMLSKASFFDNEKKFSKRKLLFLVPYLLEEMYCSKTQKCISIEENISPDTAIKNVLTQRVAEIYEDMDLPSKRNKRMLGEFCGLYGEKKTLESIGKEHKISKETVQINIKRVLLKIRKNSLVKELKELYDALEEIQLR